MAATRVRLKTPKFRVSFPNVFEKQVFEGQDASTGRYSCCALFSGFEVVNGVTSFRVPAAWPQREKEFWKALIDACNKVSIEAFKKPMAEIVKMGMRIPFRRGEEKEFDGYGPGVVFFNMSAKNRAPGVVGKDGPIRKDSEDEFYAGCYARATVTPFPYNNVSKGVAIGLNNLQKLGNGPRLDAFASAEDDFGADPADYADYGEAEGADSSDAGASAADDFA